MSVVAKMSINTSMEAAVRELLIQLGYGNNATKEDDHFDRTPARVTEALLSFAKARHDRAGDILDVTFADSYSSLVLEGPIRYVSMCAHHILPVTGEAFVGYLADGRVCGLSKLARVVDHYARQLTVQESVTDQIADALERHLKPKGCMVVIRAKHGCMAIRGVQEPDAITTTSAVRGLHKDSPNARQEFLSLIAMRGSL
jgi:GTP cyclohydrolase IA